MVKAVKINKRDVNSMKARFFQLRSKGGFGGIDDLAAYVTGKTQKIRRMKAKMWLLSQPSYAVHFPITKKYERQTINVDGIHEMWEADLMFIPFKNKSKPILVVLDCFSKRADVQIISNKKPESLVRAFENIRNHSPFLGVEKSNFDVMRHPFSLRTDQGTEFKGKPFKIMLKKHDIHHIFALNPDVKAAIVERFIRTVKTRLAKYMTHSKIVKFFSNEKLAVVLKHLIYSYNHRKHSSIGMSPMKVSLETQAVIRDRMKERQKNVKTEPLDYDIDDFVRITSHKNIFAKGYQNNFSSNIFRIVRKSINTPRMYTLEDQNGELIEGRFYTEELVPYYGKR